MLRRGLVGYMADDHMYSTAFRSLSHTLLGEAALRRGIFDRALEQFTVARDAIVAFPEKLASGHVLVRARLGLAKTFRRLGMRQEEMREREQAIDLLERRTRHDFNWTWEGCDAHGAYALASYLAAAGRGDEAFAALEQAARCCWGDLPELDADPSFARYLGDSRLHAIREAARARGRLPEYPMPR